MAPAFVPFNGRRQQNGKLEPDQKYIYLNSYDKGDFRGSVWKESAGFRPRDGRRWMRLRFRVAPGGKYLLNSWGGERNLRVLARRQEVHRVLPGVVSFRRHLGPRRQIVPVRVPSRSDVTIYRQGWQDGKLIGPPQVAVKLPFAFPLLAGGNAYDFSSDLATVVYARPAGQADLFLLSQK